MKVLCSFKRQTVKRTEKDLHAQMDRSLVVPSMYEGVYLFGRENFHSVSELMIQLFTESITS